MAGPDITTAAPADIPEGNRHDFRHDLSPDAPELENYSEGEGSSGYVHSYETGSHLDGPGIADQAECMHGPPANLIVVVLDHLRDRRDGSSSDVTECLRRSLLDVIVWIAQRRHQRHDRRLSELRERLRGGIAQLRIL